MMQEKEIIDVLYALTDPKGTYSKFAGTSICSMFENTKEKIRVHIFHDGSIKGRNKENFEKLAHTYGQEIIFYNVRKLLSKVWKEAEDIMVKAIKETRYTEAALYRLVAPQVLPRSVVRLIYMDADTLVNIDIRRLWQEKVGANGMAAVYENDLLKNYKMHGTGVGEELQILLDYWESIGVKVGECFNSGVLLMDLNKLRNRDNILLSGLRMLSKCDTENNFYDQNILNFYFANEGAPLPWYYNILQTWEREFEKSREVEGIYHYMGRSLTLNPKDLRDTRYYDYFLKTPWSDGHFLCSSYSSLENVNLRYMEKQLRLVRTLLAVLARKKLVIAFSAKFAQRVADLLEKPETFNLKIKREIKIPDYVKKRTVKVAEKEEAKEKFEKPAEVLKNIKLPEGVYAHFMGNDKTPNLNLPYDIDSYFYLMFIEGYSGVKLMLEQAGLKEENHYMDGSILVEEDVEGGVINPNKFFESL